MVIYDADGIPHLSDEEKRLREIYPGAGYQTESMPSHNYPEQPDAPPTPEAIHESSEIAAILQELIGNLPSRQGEIIKLRYLSGREISQSEAADILGITQQTVSELEGKALNNLFLSIADMEDFSDEVQRFIDRAIGILAARQSIK